VLPADLGKERRGKREIGPMSGLVWFLAGRAPLRAERGVGSGPKAIVQQLLNGRPPSSADVTVLASGDDATMPAYTIASIMPAREG
jgi:hypothetical protein